MGYAMTTTPLRDPQPVPHFWCRSAAAGNRLRVLRDPLKGYGRCRSAAPPSRARLTRTPRQRFAGATLAGCAMRWAA